MTSPAPVPAPHRSILAACAAISATLLAVVVVGHDGRRVAQLMVLALPALAWLAWPVRSTGVHHLRTGLLWLWFMAFAFDAAGRAYLLETYRAAPNSALVESAAANTNGREAAEYLAAHWRGMVVWSGALIAVGMVFLRYVRNGARVAARWPRWAMAMLCLVLLIGSAAFLSKPWRRLHPVVYWSQWVASVHSLRASWADQQQQREAALARARAAMPVVKQDGPSTVVLVITDSINRDNMALYGYQRNTTPRLLAHKTQLKEQMLVMRNAWSVDASTLPSLQNITSFGEPAARHPHHVLALARMAGYKVWWMSNHDDVAVEQQHARMADVVDIVNRVPGRAGASLDGELLDCLQEALEDPAERKLIVVHLLGAHPHYSLRFPPGANPFDNTIDAVETGMADNGRSMAVRRFRQQYDSAILYSDFVVAETLQLTRSIGRTDGYRAWMFLSDHGQEVGHSSNHAGHSPQTASGYRIPALIWRNRSAQPAAEGTELRPFRTDWAGWTIADLLHLGWKGDTTDRNALGKDYRWQNPVLPVGVPSFTE